MECEGVKGDGQRYARGDVLRVLPEEAPGLHELAGALCRAGQDYHALPQPPDEAGGCADAER